MENGNTEQHSLFQRVLIFLPVIFCAYGAFEVSTYFISSPTIEGAAILFMLLNGAAGFSLMALPIKDGDRYLRHLIGITALGEFLIWLCYFFVR